MEIKKALINRLGQPIDATYKDIDNELDFAGTQILGVRAYCFYKNKLVIVHETEGHWNIPGGGVEEGESVQDAIKREVKEETNMKVLQLRFVGLQEVSQFGESVFYVRMACMVEPYGKFVSDPGKEVMEIKLIDYKDCPKYIDPHWKEIADRLLERALEAKQHMETSNQEPKGSNHLKIEKIIEPNPEIQKLQADLVLEFKNLLPDSHVELIGSMAVPMTGRPELDIMIFSRDIEGDSLKIANTGYVQGPVVHGISNLKKKQDGIEIGVQVMPPDHKMIKVHRDIIARLRGNDELRKRYEAFKRTLAGLTRPEYKEKKMAWMEENLLN